MSDPSDSPSLPPSPAQPTSAGESAAAAAKDGAAPRRSGFPVRALGFVLLLAALFLYVRDLNASSRRDVGAQAVRYVAGASVLGLGLRAAPGGAVGADGRVYEPCSAAVASNILVRLAEARPGKAPTFSDAVRAYDLFLFLTNRSRVFLGARREPGSDDLWVAMREPRREGPADAKDGGVSFVEFPPALVTGLGPLFDEIDSGNLETLRGARALPAAVERRTYTNFVRRAGVAGLTEADLGRVDAELRAVASVPIDRGAVGPGPSAASAGPIPLRSFAADVLHAVCGALAAARPVEMPEGTFEGEELSLLLFLADGHAVRLRAAVPAQSPEDALVGFLEEVEDAEGKGGRLRVSAPALVPGLGKILSAAVPPASAPEEASAPEPAGDAR